MEQNDYYKKNDHLSYQERCNINFDHPNAIDFELLINHVKELKKGNDVQKSKQ